MQHPIQMKPADSEKRNGKFMHEFQYHGKYPAQPITVRGS